MTPREIGMWAQLGSVITGKTFWECADALAAAARQGGDGTAPGEAPQSGHEVATPNPSSPSHIPLMNKDTNRG